MSVSRLLVPVTALAVAAAPVVMPAPAVAPAPPLVHVEAIQLAGIGQNIYNAITPVVQYVVGGVSYLINFLPFGGIVAAQINIDYFQGIQPAVAATVDYAAALLHAPLDFFPITRAYVNTLVGIQYDLVSAQLRFLGFNELPPRPASARVSSPRAAASTAASDDLPAPAVVAEQAAAHATPARAARPVRTREARTQDNPVVRPSASATARTAASARAGSDRGTPKPERHARAAAGKRAAATN